MSEEGSPESRSDEAPAAPAAPPVEAAPLQFDKAEIDDAPAAPTCASCKKPVTTYFQIGAVVVCSTCRDAVVRALEVGKAPGRFVRALLQGGLAAIGGAVVWYFIREITHLEIGLVAVGVGILVGMAVKRASGGFGGKRYQALAVALTYASITMSNVPLIVSEIRKQAPSAVVAQGAAPVPGASPVASPASDAPEEAQPEAAAGEHKGSSPSVSGFFVAWAWIFALALAMPFLSGVQNILGIVIIGIGLYQAWKINRFVPPAVLGPFEVARAGTGATPPAASPGG